MRTLSPAVTLLRPGDSAWPEQTLSADFWDHLLHLTQALDCPLQPDVVWVGPEDARSLEQALDRALDTLRPVRTPRDPPAVSDADRQESPGQLPPDLAAFEDADAQRTLGQIASFVTRGGCLIATAP